MNTSTGTYRIFPLGDSAITVDFGNTIDEGINQRVLRLFYHLREHPLPGMTEAVPAYSSLTVYYNLAAIRRHPGSGTSAFEYVSNLIRALIESPPPEMAIPSRVVEIPVCYDRSFAPDLEFLARERNISPEELIHIHISRTYRVYMIGFMPGFSYMGELDERIAFHRKGQPVTVAAGSVGIAGRQTGIYPLESPGGWQIIGRTPLRLFDRAMTIAEEHGGNACSLLHPGDTVRFISIGKHEFENY